MGRRATAIASAHSTLAGSNKPRREAQLASGTHQITARRLLESSSPGRYTGGFPRGPDRAASRRVGVAESILPQRCTVYYSGRVQGVGFRFTARRIAGRFHVSGYVQNLDDGRVLLVAEGATEELDQFLAAIARELGRHIDNVQHAAGPARGEFEAFDIRYA